MKALFDFIDANPHKKFVVIFDDLKRFARDTEFHLKLRTAFRSRDVILKCLNYNFDESPEGRFVETVLAAGNELERHQNQRQVVQKMKARLEAGYWAFGVKRGYKMVKDPLHGKLPVKNGKEAKLLTEALEGFSNGVFIRKIDACKYLVENGFWKNEPKNYVFLFDCMLRDSFYAGYIEYKKWEVSKRIGKHTGIISLETYERNQKRLGSIAVNKRIRVDASSDLPLRGLLVCAGCNKHLTGSKTVGNGGAFWYYFCQNKKCEFHRQSINRDTAQSKFKKLLTEQNVKPELEELSWVIFNKVWREEVNKLQIYKKETKIHHDTTQEQIGKYAELAVNAPSLKLRKVYESKIESMMTDLEAKPIDLTDPVDLSLPYQTAMEKVFGLLKNPYKIWESVDVKEKHKLFFFLFEEKLPYSKKDGYTTNKIPSAVRLFEEFVTPSTSDVV